MTDRMNDAAKTAKTGNGEKRKKKQEKQKCVQNKNDNAGVESLTSANWSGDGARAKD